MVTPIFTKFQKTNSMKKFIITFIIAAISYNFIFSQSTKCCDVQSFFSPSDDCERIIMNYIDSAKSQIRISMYAFTSFPIANKLISVSKRVPDIIVFCDNTQSSNNPEALGLLQQAHIKVRIKQSKVLEHNKIMMIDNRIILTGSYNWSKSAKTQDNNLLVLKCPHLISAYQQEFQFVSTE